MLSDRDPNPKAPEADAPMVAPPKSGSEVESSGLQFLQPVRFWERPALRRVRAGVAVCAALGAAGLWVWFSAPAAAYDDLPRLMLTQALVGILAASLTWVVLSTLGMFRWLGAGYGFVGLLVVSSAIGAVHWSNWRHAERAGEQVGESLSAFASMFAADLQAAGHWKIGLDTPPDDPLYLKMIEAQKRWVRSNPGIADVYTMRRMPDASVALIVDSETDYDRNGKFEGDAESRTEIGERYDEPTESMLGALGGRALIDEEISEDRWGTWISACHPMRDAEGRIDGIVGVDFSAEQWTAPMIKARHSAAVQSGIWLGMTLVGMWTLALTRRAAAVRGASLHALQRQQRELEEATLAADRANQAKSRFLANMSHEIRTPLTAILGFTDVLKDDEAIVACPERMEVVDTIRNAGQHLLMLINDILDFSKIESDRMTIERVETPLVAMLHDVERLLAAPARVKGLSLRTALANPAPDRIMSDPTRLRQILMNLVGNAVKFTESGGVTITTSCEEREGQRRLVIDVEDTGPGLTPQQVERLFQAFGQADETVTRRHGGTGLGLTISRRLAGLMGGGVWLKHTEPGRGACFTVDLPLEPAPDARQITTLEAPAEHVSREPAPPGAAALRGRILLVEDGVDNQRLIAHHLRKAGAEVVIAGNGAIAIERIECASADNAPFDLILTDMQMPIMDGYALARALRARGCALPIVALTAHAMPDAQAECLRAGCDAYTTKPIDKVELLKLCAAWMSRVSVRATKAA